jgi:hypothetical protein
MKILYALEVLKVIELILDSSVNRLNITIITPDPYRNPLVAAAEALNDFLKAIACPVLPETANKFRIRCGMPYGRGYDVPFLFQNYFTILLTGRGRYGSIKKLLLRCMLSSLKVYS